MLRSSERKGEKKRKINEAKESAALPIDNVSSFDGNIHAAKLSSAVVTPMGTSNDSRWFRNDLLKKEMIVYDNNTSTISSNSSDNINSVVSFDDDKSIAIKNLRKKVIMQLIDVTQQPSPEKSKLFSNLVKKTDGTNLILEMAHEMGSSVTDTKTMLMNNCV